MVSIISLNYHINLHSAYSLCTYSVCTVAGAMRLPGTGKPDWTGPSHFVTDFYAQHFQLPLKKFINTGDQGYYSIYGEPPN